jgi:hypothetical protein
MSILSRSRLLHTKTPVPNVPAHSKYDGSQLQKAFRAGSRLKPLHCGNLQGCSYNALCTFKLVILCAEERECNCLRGQVNGHKATCTSPCPPPVWAAVLANEFCRIFSIPRFIFACTSSCHCFGLYCSRPRRAWARVFVTLALQFKGGSKQDAWIGIWIVIRAECRHCGHILVPAVVNWLM